MNKTTAKEIAVKYLSKLDVSSDFRNVILDKYTIERESLCVFFYESSLYLENGDINNRLAGNAPILIDKNTGDIHLTGTSNPIEFYIKNYEKNHRRSRRLGRVRETQLNLDDAFDNITLDTHPSAVSAIADLVYWINRSVYLI